MSPSTDIIATELEQQVALLLPLSLQPYRKLLLNEAKGEDQRATARQAWSLRQANWLGEVAARATHIQEIDHHLDNQGKRWSDDKEANLRFHQTISRRIGKALRRDILKAMQTTAEKVAEVLGQSQPQTYTPSEAWVDQEQLKLARLYIGALVAYYRIDTEEQR